jgi:hypothetical protein
MRLARSSKQTNSEKLKRDMYWFILLPKWSSLIVFTELLNQEREYEIKKISQLNRTSFIPLSLFNSHLINQNQHLPQLLRYLLVPCTLYLHLTWLMSIISQVFEIYINTQRKNINSKEKTDEK